MEEIDFAGMSYDRAASLVKPPPQWVEMNRLYVGATDDGDVDHWQAGLSEEEKFTERARRNRGGSPAGYIGPLPTLSHKKDPNRSLYVNGLQRTFTSEDLLKDVTQRRRSGVLGQQPHTGFLPLEENENVASGSAQEQGGAEEEEASEEEAPDPFAAQTEAFERYHEKKNGSGVMRDHAQALCYAGESFLLLRVARVWEDVDVEGSEGPVRALVQPEPDSTEDALSYIYLEQIDVDDAAIVRDTNTMQEGIVLLGAADEEGVEMAEITYLNDAGQTVYRTVYSDDSEDEVEVFDMGGRLLMHHSEHDLFLTESMRDNQRSVNTTRTMMERSNHKAGFPQLVAINLEEPKDDDGKSTSLDSGPGKIAFVASAPRFEETEEGTVENMGTPSLEVIEPADVEGLRSSVQDGRVSIYRGAQQLHVLLSGDATASGKSRIEARAEFERDLTEFAKPLNEAGKWFMEAAWALGENLAGEVPQQREMRAEYACQVDPGPIDPETYKALLLALKQNAISMERFMRLTGVEDTQAERERIKQDLEELQRPRDAAETARVQAAVEREEQGRPQDVERRVAEIEAALTEVSANGAGTNGSSTQAD